MDFFRQTTILSLEQATVLPYLTYRLAQDGMQVLRLEHPVYGDPNRLVGDNVLGEERMNAYFLCINAGKKALTLDLARPEGQEILRSLIGSLDVAVFATNQLPKNYLKLGIDYDTLKGLKEDLIWVGISGFGPDSNEAAYEPILEARSGLMELTGEKDGDPMHLGIPLADMGTAEHTYGLVMKALLKREKTGEGSKIEVSMFESATSWLTVPITLTATFNERMSRRGNIHPFFTPVSVFQTKNGYVYMAVGNNKQWKAMVRHPLFQTLDRPLYEENEGRREDVTALNRALGRILKTRTSEELIDLFKGLGVPISRINSLAEVVSDPLVRGKTLRSRDPETGLELTLAPPPNLTPFLKASKRQLSFPPRFGEHNQEIYGGKLGYADEQLQRFKREKLI